MFCPDCGNWNRAAASHCTRCGETLPELKTALDKPDEEITALRRVTGSRYRVIRRLGSGGMAHVYHGEHVLLNRPLVIKVLHAHLARDPEMRERFRREAQAAAQLVHPNICAILDYGELESSVFIVMPLLSGGSLADEITRERTVSCERACAIAAQVACGLDYAHRHGIVHRDIKPDNILFDEDGNAQITDFGIATARFHGRLTGTGRAMGTPHYMSPEQAMGRIVDGRSDLYSVGIMLYEMVLGFPPFDGADSYSVGYKQVHEPVVPPVDVDSRTPQLISDLIVRCLQKDPMTRFQSGADLADALLGVLVTMPDAGPHYRMALASRNASQVTPR